jgi:chromosome segregation protein
MKFTRLKLHGFKSFCDLTELHFEPGLTGVVGPNGCGKSNLVEALRWVMGESSYKAMRAGGMDDVIFAGSGNRPSRNSAEVTLVLDNTDRTAPAALNNADVLEVTRRIEREAGSVYRVNGREVRARDVQILFADASTGAHSPALVRQGQIGELIAAKPVQRRALLEEAAGISGLYSRRHEAELKLKGAEQNLERVEDVIAQLETQLETLKRQARQANRYRGLSGEIRKAEAGLFHVRWTSACTAEAEAEAQQRALITELGDAMHLEQVAQRQLEIAETALQPLRDREAASGAALQRLIIAAEQLEEDARRAEARRNELSARIQQISADVARERTLLGESAQMLAGLDDEAARLAAESVDAAGFHATAEAEARGAALTVAAAETVARTATEELAQVRARRAAAQRGTAEAAARLDRVTGQIAQVARDAAALGDALGADSEVASRQAELDAARVRAESADTAAIGAEETATGAQAALDAARPRLQDVDARLHRLEAEAQTLAKTLQHGSKGLWPPVVDALTVAAGYETALGAALGEDLEAPADAGAPLHWAGPYPSHDDPPLPVGATPLSRFVSGSDVLQRRLSQIGVVGKAQGSWLQGQLRPGQRLVTAEGDLWRWDGFVAAADAPSAAAERLARRNRLAELDGEIAAVRKDRDGRKAEIVRLTAALESARAAERQTRETARSTRAETNVAQQALDRAQKAVGDLVARRSALEEARVRLATNRDEAEALKAEAEQTLTATGDEAPAAKALADAQNALADARMAADAARLALATLEGAGRQRETRLNQIATERAAWTRRRDGAQAQIAALERRGTELSAELASHSAAPDLFAQRRAALADETDAARAAHQVAADALVQAQAVYRDSDKALRLAAEGLAGAREAVARVEERLKGLIAQRHQIERQVHETLGSAADETAAIAGLKPGETLPDEDALEHKVERLKAERERLGGVNLMAEQEAEEVREKLDALVRDRDDLVGAIAKLRSGIQSLNREGRVRLSEAFDKVNQHFQALFTSLFGGGTAELQFVESDDPLEAGLEVIARPPGKKPTTMTLLSGGEQALTAMSLIFAVFLTNPAPICVLDEVDAPLDDANVERFCTLLDTMVSRTETRFIVITHNPITMSRVDRLFGVTMMERGVSQLVSVDLTGAHAVRASAVAAE